MNVIGDGVGLRFANGKTGIPTLPGEIVDALGFEPARGIALAEFNKLRHRQRTRQLKEGVHVVGGTADC
jgi:hypothetical protein